MVVAADIEIEFAVLYKICRELGNMHHLGGFGIFKFSAGYGRHRFFHKIGRTIHCIHILIDYPPHVTTLSAENPFNAQSFGLGIHFCV